MITAILIAGGIWTLASAAFFMALCLVARKPMPVGEPCEFMAPSKALNARPLETKFAEVSW